MLNWQVNFIRNLSLAQFYLVAQKEKELEFVIKWKEEWEKVELQLKVPRREGDGQ